MSAPTYWWLSFVDSHRPVGQRHLGCCIVLGDSMVDAIKCAHMLGCNPGGEVVGCEVASVPADMIGRMLTPDELARYGERLT